MAGKSPLPVGHPSIEKFVCISSVQKMDICYTHPPIHGSLIDTNRVGYTYPDSHQSLQSWSSSIPGWPSDHDNVDMELRSLAQYEADHPNMDNYVQRRAANAVCFDFSGSKFPAAGVCPTSVHSWHPAIDAAINNARTVFPASHSKTHDLFFSWMPASHRYRNLVCRNTF